MHLWIVYVPQHALQIEHLLSYLSPDEIQRAKRFHFAKDYTQVEAAAQSRAFYDLWTRKEAFIKAVGEGLSFPLQDFVVSVHLEAAVLKYVNPLRGAAGPWTLHSLQLPENYVGTVAVATAPPCFSYYDYQTEPVDGRR